MILQGRFIRGLHNSSSRPAIRIAMKRCFIQLILLPGVIVEAIDADRFTFAGSCDDSGVWTVSRPKLAKIQHCDSTLQFLAEAI